MAKLFVALSALLAIAVAEPPVSSSYLPPGRGGAIGSQYGPPSANSFGGSSGFRTPASTSYLPPSNNLELDSFGGRKGSAGRSGYSSGLSNTYGAPFQGQGLRDFGSDSVTVDAASRFGSSGSFGQPSGTYGVPGRDSLSSTYGAPSQSYGAPSSRSGFGSSSFNAPSRSYGAPGSGQPSGVYGAPQGGNQLSGVYGAPFRSGSGYNTQGRSGLFNGNGYRSGQLSSTYGAPSRSSQSLGSYSQGRAGQPSSRYGAPSRSSFGSGSGLSSTYGAPEGQDRFTSAIPSNTYGTPFNSAADNSFGAPSGSYGAPSNTYGAPSNGFNSQYSRQLSSQYGAPGYGKKTTTEDPLAEPANYQYNYEVRDEEGFSGTEFGHQESREDESARGVYHVLLPDGRMQIVEYEADEEGYRPQIRYEETGYPGARSGQDGQGY